MKITSINVEFYISAYSGLRNQDCALGICRVHNLRRLKLAMESLDDIFDFSKILQDTKLKDTKLKDDIQDYTFVSMQQIWMIQDKFWECVSTAGEEFDQIQEGILHSKHLRKRNQLDT